MKSALTRSEILTLVAIVLPFLGAALGWFYFTPQPDQEDVYHYNGSAALIMESQNLLIADATMKNPDAWKKDRPTSYADLLQDLYQYGEIDSRTSMARDIDWNNHRNSIYRLKVAYGKDRVPIVTNEYVDTFAGKP